MEGAAQTPTVETPPAPFGIAHFWEGSDIVIHSVAIILLIMSILSWTQIAVKCWQASKRRKNAKALEKFWQSPTVEDAIAGLEKQDSHNLFTGIAQQAFAAAGHYEAHRARTIGGSTGQSEYLTRALRQGIVRSASRLEAGLTLLASIGSIAPFVGLFGTVWGIYHALLSVASAGSASIDKVSGPVGEALIMTAAGLFVAIPAVLAFNAFTRLNRVELAELDGFAHDLHAYFDTGARMGSRTNIRVVRESI